MRYDLRKKKIKNKLRNILQFQTLHLPLPYQKRNNNEQ